MGAVSPGRVAHHMHGEGWVQRLFIRFPDDSAPLNVSEADRRAQGQRRQPDPFARGAGNCHRQVGRGASRSYESQLDIE